MFARLNSLKITRLAVVLALVVASLLIAACGKKELVRTTSDAITATKAGLEIAESAHRNNVMAVDAYKSILETGSVVVLVLGEVNEFAAKFPENGEKPTEDQKVFVLTRIDDALGRFDKLIANGALIKDPDGQRQYLTRVRQAKALVKGLADSIRKIKAVKSPTATVQPFNTPRLLRV